MPQMMGRVRHITVNMISAERSGISLAGQKSLPYNETVKKETESKKDRGNGGFAPGIATGYNTIHQEDASCRSIYSRIHCPPGL